jgi:hypothetical protein
MNVIWNGKRKPRTPKQNIVAQWSGWCEGERLYWRDAHPKWKWGEGEIARSISAAGERTSYFSLDEVRQRIDAKIAAWRASAGIVQETNTEPDYIRF